MHKNNYKRVQKLMRSITLAETALKEIKMWRAANPLDGDGSEGLTEKKLYNFHLAEYEDGSGRNIKLSGLFLGQPVLSFIESELKNRIEAFEEELHTL